MHKIMHLLKVTLLIFICLLISNKSMAAVQLDGIAAVVNDKIITVSQLNDRIVTIKRQLQRRKIKLPPDDILGKQVLQLLINQTLEAGVAKRLHITATSADVDHALKSIAEQEKATVAQLYQSVKKQGVSKTEFIKELKKQIVTEKLLHTVVVARIKVTPQEINAATKAALSQAGSQNEFHLLHILIPIPDSPTPQQVASARNKAEKLVKQLENGESFKTLAAAQSRGTQVFNGGDLGWKTLTELPTVFASRVTNMKQNSIAGPIKTANGFHIIKLIGIRGKTINMNKTQLHQQIRGMLIQRKLAEAQQSWLEQLRATAYIKILYKPQSLPTPL